MLRKKSFSLSRLNLHRNLPNRSEHLHFFQKLTCSSAPADCSSEKSEKLCSEVRNIFAQFPKKLLNKLLLRQCSSGHVECSFDNRVKKFRLGDNFFVWGPIKFSAVFFAIET